MKRSLSQSRSISVILPLYGCLGQLPAHLQSLHSLSTIVHEFIWVIQEGPNGSQQLAKEAACRLGGQIIEAPKGLHHAWNQGVSLATGPYTYFSTIGDFISVQDLANLIICLEQTGAHGVFSPPRVWPATRGNFRKCPHWPIFLFPEIFSRRPAGLLPREVSMVVQILSGGSCLLGSFASCLFQTSFLRGRPFPTDDHHYGDTVWTYRHLPEMILSYYPDFVARFNMQDSSNRLIIAPFQADTLARRLANCLSKPSREYALACLDASANLNACHTHNSSLPWWLNPQLWKLRRKRDFLRNQLKQTLVSL